MAKIIVNQAIKVPAAKTKHPIQSIEEKKAVVNRLARAIGHLRKIEKMVATDEDCVAILTQLSAVRAEVTNTGKVILESHLSEGLLAASKSGDPHEIDALNEAIERFVK
jgi:CsoR family transcriptional regulator, copper-sensing transcriptional repressor